MAENINITISNVVRQGGLSRIRVSKPSSSVDKVTVNEWPVILNALAKTAFADVDTNTGFTYTFPFALAKGSGFPYCFTMQLEATTIDGEEALSLDGDDGLAVLG